MPPSHYRAMWLFALFDLPVKTKAQRRDYTRFRNALLKQGFLQLQYSVYARHIPSEDADRAYRRRIRAELPPEGQIRLISITDRQFGKMDIFYGKKREPVEDVPPQMQLY